MGRRNQHTEAEKKALAIKSLHIIIEEEGITGLTSRKIAGRMGYTVGMLYHMFGSLDDLILHANYSTLDLLYHKLHRTLHEQQITLGEELEEEETKQEPKEKNIWHRMLGYLKHEDTHELLLFPTVTDNYRFTKVHSLALTYMAFSQEHKNKWQLLFEHHFPPEKTLPEWYLEKLDQIFGLIESAIKQECPLLSRQECQEAVQLLLAGLHGIASMGFSGTLAGFNAPSPYTLADDLVTHLLASMKQPQMVH